MAQIKELSSYLSNKRKPFGGHPYHWCMVEVHQAHISGILFSADCSVIYVIKKAFHVCVSKWFMQFGCLLPETAASNSS